MEREGVRGSSDVRWQTVPQTSGCDRKRSVDDSGQTTETSTSNIVDEAERNIVVVWLQCMLVESPAFIRDSGLKYAFHGTDQRSVFSTLDVHDARIH